jgi:hypothetical protein
LIPSVAIAVVVPWAHVVSLVLVLLLLVALLALIRESAELDPNAATEDQLWT